MANDSLPRSGTFLPRTGTFRTSSSKNPQNIVLQDEEVPEDQRHCAERRDSDASSNPDAPGRFTLTKRLTNNSVQLQQSLKRELTKRKYAKFDRNRYELENCPNPPHEDPESQPQPGEAATPQQVGALERGRTKAKKLMRRKRNMGGGQDTEDYVVDILYENQRGAFLFGTPRYSASSLLPPDPKPWQNGQFRTSPVDIRHAQVPDPSWEWSWRSWYVDMSRDVDEEGWEYSLQFRGGWAWHGNHPWFHSFVRRRRWLRMRKRRVLRNGANDRAHDLTEEYFTIHPRALRPASEDWSRKGTSELANTLAKMQEEPEEVEKAEIESIGELIRVLKKVTIDREKLVAVRKFVAEGGDELYYLSERMPDIMAQFVFQSSRRQLLADLLRRFDSARERRNSLDEHHHDGDGAQNVHVAAERRIGNLMRAVKAADELVKKLEYWSDIKDMSFRGETLREEPEGRWDTYRWQGLSSPPDDEDAHPEQTFASKQIASEGAHELHPHPEHIMSPESDNIWYDAPQRQGSGPKEKTTGEDLSRYTTAAESTSQASRRDGKSARKKGKGKARASASGLDGLEERDEDDEDEVYFSTASEGTSDDDDDKVGHEEAASPDLRRHERDQSVQMVEPVSLNEMSGEGQGGAS